MALPAPLNISVVSESAWTVRNHGVHTAFVEQVGALRKLEHRVAINSIRACRESDLTITHSPGPWSLAALRASAGLRVAIAHVTPGTLHESLRGEEAWGRMMQGWLRRLYRAADLVGAVSPSTAVELSNLGVAENRIVSSPLGVDPPLVGAGSDDCPGWRRRRRKLVLGVGQLQPRKGVEEFAAVAASLPRHDFVWAGGRPFGPLTAGGLSGRRLAAPNLTFAGSVSEAQLQALYRRAGAFLFLSRQENFGQVVVEAAHHEVPLLLSRISAFEDHFGEGAQLVDRCEATARLAQALESRGTAAELAARSRGLGKRFGATEMTALLLGRLESRTGLGSAQ